MSSVLDVVKQLNKKYEDKNLLIKADVKPNYVRLRSRAFGLAYPLFGGLVLGRSAVFSGQAHSGKTTAACLAIADYQRQFPEKLCVYVDVEHSLDLQFQARMNGVDFSKLYYMNPTNLSGEEILQAVLDLQESDDIGMIVIDSVPALLPKNALEKDLTEDPGMRGTIANALHRFMIKMSSELIKKGNILVMINQVRVSGKTFTGAPIYSEPGGQALQFYSSIKLRFGTRTFIKGDKTDCSDGEGAEGFRLKFVITKNKCGSITRGGGFISYSYQDGLREMEDLLEIAYKFEFIERLNNVTYQLVNLETGEVLYDEEGKELKGKKKDLELYLNTHEDFKKEYLDMLNNYIANSNDKFGDCLSSEEIKSIKEEDTNTKVEE